VSVSELDCLLDTFKIMRSHFASVLLVALFLGHAAGQTRDLPHRTHDALFASFLPVQELGHDAKLAAMFSAGGNWVITTMADCSPDRVAYTEFSPCSQLAPYIHCYWQLAAAGALKHPILNRVLPDGCADIVLNLGDPAFAQPGCATPRSRSRITFVGPMITKSSLDYLLAAPMSMQMSDAEMLAELGGWFPSNGPRSFANSGA
jgi:hypothetical protein